MNGRVNTDGHTDQNRQHQAGQRQSQRVGNTLPQKIEDRLVIRIGSTKIAVKNIVPVHTVLLELTLIQAHFFFHFCNVFRCCLGPQHSRSRVAGDHSCQNENESDDNKKDGDHLQKTSKNCLYHFLITCF